MDKLEKGMVVPGRCKQTINLLKIKNQTIISYAVNKSRQYTDALFYFECSFYRKKKFISNFVSLAYSIQHQLYRQETVLV